MAKWGAIYWNFFHIITILYPKIPSEKHIQQAQIFLSKIGDVIPCNLCRTHYKAIYSKMPQNINHLKSKENFLAWFIYFHNIVNENLKKKVFSTGEAMDHIERLKERPIINFFITTAMHIKHLIPENIKTIPYGTKTSITKFISSTIFLLGLKSPTTIDFNNRLEYVKLIREIGKINGYKK